MITSTLTLMGCPLLGGGGGGGGAGAAGERTVAGGGGGGGGAWSCAVAAAVTLVRFVAAFCADCAVADEANNARIPISRTIRRDIYGSPSADKGTTVSRVRPIASGGVLGGASIAG